MLIFLTRTFRVWTFVAVRLYWRIIQKLTQYCDIAPSHKQILIFLLSSIGFYTYLHYITVSSWILYQIKNWEWKRSIFETSSQWNSADRTYDFHLLYLKPSRIDSSQSEQGKTTRIRRSISVQIDKQASSILPSCRLVRISRLLIHSAGNLRPIQMCSYVNFIILFVGYIDSSADRDETAARTARPTFVISPTN